MKEPYNLSNHFSKDKTLNCKQKTLYLSIYFTQVLQTVGPQSERRLICKSIIKNVLDMQTFYIYLFKQGLDKTQIKDN